MKHSLKLSKNHNVDQLCSTPPAKLDAMNIKLLRILTLPMTIWFTTAPCLAAHAGSSEAATPPVSSSVSPLYQRLGGDIGVRQMVAETLATVSTDPRTRRTFEKVDMKRLQTKIVEHICALTNGGCAYTGDTMKQSHAGMNITEAEFYLMIKALRAALDRHVGEREKNELLKILAPMKRDIVTG